jgi:leucyl aminopeptidase
MQVTRVATGAVDTEADALVVGVYSDGSLGGPAAEVDKALKGVVSDLIERKEFTGKANEALSLWSNSHLDVQQVVLVGLGERRKLDRHAAFAAAGAAANKLAVKKRSRVAFHLQKGLSPELVESAVVGAMVGCHGQDLYRAEKNRFPFEEILMAGPAKAVSTGQIVGEAVNLTRRLVNEPPQEIYPQTFAEQAAAVAGDCGLEIEIWDEKRLEDERCGSLMGVAKGSTRPPRLVILRHRGGKPSDPLLAVVGKGVTFDSGGLSLKPTDSMKTMKGDMAGAATMLGAMQAIARLKLPINVIGLGGLVENMPSGHAMKLGDVLHARSGKTIEVLNTDAEGRLVLADVLNVAVEQGAAKIVDLATLTGSCCVALGLDVAGLFTNDQAWCDTVAAAARACGEAVWQMPMYPEYTEEIKSEVADIKNIGSRWGGAITAAKFLEEFVAGKPWVHMDIAGPSYLEKAKPWNEGGATGMYVRTLVEIARGWET